MSDSFVIRTQGLTRDFETVRAVDTLDLEVETGIVFGFLGPNGSGKTTTIRLLLGLLEPTRGRAEVLGFDIRTQPDRIRERTGALLEHTGLYERLSAEENLEFSGLDPVAAAALREDLATLAAREGVTVFLTTHNLTEAEKLCARVAVIRKGRLLAVGHPDELRARSGKPQAEIYGRGFNAQVLVALRARPEVAAITQENSHLTIKLNGAVEIAPLVSLIVQAGGQIEEVRKGQANLEEAFLDLVEDEK